MDVENDGLEEFDDGSHSTPNADFPAVVVVYKEREYPLASNSPDAFFSDSAVQDFSVKDLLAHFRDVLGEEVSQMEELVIKVDELGLEFSEVS